MNICPHLTLWISDFLSNRSQKVCIRQPENESKQQDNRNPDKVQTDTHCYSSTRSINTGTPQGTVISPFIFTLYTNDCRSKQDTQKTYKFSDDTAIVDFSESEQIFEDSVRDFSDWCDQNFFWLHAFWIFWSYFSLFWPLDDRLVSLFSFIIIMQRRSFGMRLFKFWSLSLYC